MNQNHVLYAQRRCQNFSNIKLACKNLQFSLLINILLIDLAYLNTSKEQFSKLLVIADQCTCRLSALPVRKLKSSSIIRMLQLYPCCNPYLRQISCNMGTEYSINLDKFLQILNIRLTSDGTGINRQHL